MDDLTWQGSLLDTETPGFDPAYEGIRRIHLDDGAWIDHRPGWVSGSDALFTQLVHGSAWEQGTERIQGRQVLRPRLTTQLPAVGLPPELALWEEVGTSLSQRYGVRFERIGINLYRDGRDSVAWHGDRVARDLPTATIAIVSLGQARPFRFKPTTGGPSQVLLLGHGDLMVMGGSFQRTWRHAVPKVTTAGPRISVTYRHAYPPQPT